MTKVVLIKRFPIKGGFYAINLFGIIFSVQKLNAVELNHERIHTAQERELLFIGFYVWYVLEWLCLLIKYRDGIKAYYNIRFEKEAYHHQNDLDYLAHRKRYHYR
ncbi:MAG: hypothetical protein ACI4T9_12690 [Prevotella sp.]